MNKIFKVKRKSTTPVRKATPEETLAFWGKPVVIVGQRRPKSKESPQTKTPTGQEYPLNLLKTLGLPPTKGNQQVALYGEQEPPEDPTGQN